MRISDRGIELLKQFEGCELEAYQDIAGIWTIGYGHTGPDVQEGMKISESDAEAILRQDLKSREKAIERLVHVPLNQNEFDALVSFVYNVGEGALKGSTALKRLNKGDRVGAAEALTWWNKATVNGVLREVKGLTRRRQAEKALFLTPVEPANVRDQENLDENTRVTPVEDTPRRDSLAESRTVQGAAVAGGAGVAASTLGKDNADELNQLETNIENGTSMTEEAPANDNGQAASDGTEETAADTTGQPATSGSKETTVGGPSDAQSGKTDEETATGQAATGGEDGQVVVGGDNAAEAQTTQEVAVPTAEHPSKHEAHAAQAQIQFALLLLIVLSVLFIIYARFDDWRNYKR